MQYKTRYKKGHNSWYCWRKIVIEVISKLHFQFHYMIGKGGFSKVWQVEKKKGRKLYALKEMSKARILAKKSVSSVINEKKILTQLHNEYLKRYIFAL